MSIGDDELHAPEAAPGKLAEKGRPERLCLRRPDIETQDLAPTIAVGSDRYDDGDRHDPALLAHLHVGGVDPEIGPVALDRPVEEGFHPFVDFLAEPADLALRDPGHPSACHSTKLRFAEPQAGSAHRLDQVIH